MRTKQSQLQFPALREVARVWRRTACQHMFIVASDLEGNCLFERENEKIAENLDRVYEGTRPAVLKRFGETDDRSDELI